MRTRVSDSAWLRSIPADFAHDVLSAAQIAKVPAGQLMFERGDPPGGLVGIASGLVTVGMDDSHSSVVFGHVFGRGDWFGEIPTLTNTPRTVSAVTLSDCDLLTVPIAQMRSICETQHQGWRWLAILIAINSGVAVRIARDLLITDPRQRIVSVLRRLIGRRNLPFELALTQGQLAELCALSRGVVSRILREFETQGQVKLGYRVVTFQDHPIWRSDG